VYASLHLRIVSGGSRNNYAHDGCTPVAIPAGYHVAPPDAEALHVCGAYPWQSSFLVFSDGDIAGTSICGYGPSTGRWGAVEGSTEVFNTKNDSERRTFEDIFWKRQFASNVTKESNVYDRRIDQYAKGIEALIESDRVKSDIFRFEHDLWQF
jgi:hypothetical protein